MNSTLLGKYFQEKNYFKNIWFTRQWSSMPVPDAPNKNSSPKGIRKVTTLTELQRWALVFSKKYKTKADIPEYVPYEVIERANSRARIKVSNYLMILTLAGCLIYAYSGRSASKRGESVSQMNIDWHKDYNEKIRLEKEQRDK